MSRKTVILRRKAVQVRRVGGDISAVMPRDAKGKGIRGGWRITSNGFARVDAREFRGADVLCCKTISPEKRQRWERL